MTHVRFQRSGRLPAHDSYKFPAVREAARSRFMQVPSGRGGCSLLIHANSQQSGTLPAHNSCKFPAVGEVARS